MNPALEPFIPTFDHALIDATRERLAKHPISRGRNG